MSESVVMERPPQRGAEVTDERLLERLVTGREMVALHEVEELRLVMRWAAAHPATGDDTVLTHDEYPGGEGTPGVAAFTAEPLGIALRIPTSRAQALIGDVLDLEHRLPRLWHDVARLEVPVWRARRIATATRTLTLTQAAWVDRQLVGHAATLGTAALDRLVATACARVDPDRQREREQDAQADWDLTLTHRHGHISDGSDGAPESGWVGTSELTAIGDTRTLDEIHALVIEHAHLLEGLDPDTPLGARKVQALALLVTHGLDQQVLDLTTGEITDRTSGEKAAPAHARGCGRGRGRSKVRFYLHADLAQLLAGDPDAIGTVETLGPLTLARIKEWVGHSQVTIVPVLDLAGRSWSPRHDPPPRMGEQVMLRDEQCIFPFCTRPARHCDLDHITPWRHTRPPEPGQDPPVGSTHPGNISPACRRHHRAKTTNKWRYQRLPDGNYLWEGPHSQLILVTPQGTQVLT